MQQEITRNEFIRKFNKLDKPTKTAILLKADMTKAELEDIGDLNDVQVTDLVEYFGDHEVICNVWTIMQEEKQAIIEKNKADRLTASQDFKNGKIDLVTYAHILNNITYSEEKHGIMY